jgi:hypothetical protein
MSGRVNKPRWRPRRAARRGLALVAAVAFGVAFVATVASAGGDAPPRPVSEATLREEQPAGGVPAPAARLRAVARLPRLQRERRRAKRAHARRAAARRRARRVRTMVVVAPPSVVVEPAPTPAPVAPVPVAPAPVAPPPPRPAPAPPPPASEPSFDTSGTFDSTG